MTSIVLELQKDALNGQFPLTDLLRKSLLVAKKLGVAEFETWILNELNGYTDGKNVPEYRHAHGSVVVNDPYRGWIPVVFKHPEKQRHMSSMPFIQAIAELDDLYHSGKGSESLLMSYSPEAQRRFMDSTGALAPPVLDVPRNQLRRVLESARTIVLNWALQLEKDGIVGEGLSFSQSEKETAGRVSYNINNFYGHVSHSQIQQDTDASTQSLTITNEWITGIKQFTDNLSSKIDSLGLSSIKQLELQAEIATVQAQTKSPVPKSSTIRTSLEVIQRILEGAAGGAAAQLIWEIGKLLT